MKIIFLDIDGVITSARTGWMNWDIYATTFIRWVCEQSGAKIVISSTWRKNHGKSFFASILGDVLHADHETPVLHEIRGIEIRAWLEGHPEVTEYIILDDDADMLPEQAESLIITDSLNGLMIDNYHVIMDRLGVKITPVWNHNLFQHPNMFYEHNTAHS